MLQWMSGHTTQDKIRNDIIKEKVGVSLIVGEMVKSCLGWFVALCMLEKTLQALIRRVDQMKDSLLGRGRGRPRKTISQIVKRELELNGLKFEI